MQSLGGDQYSTLAVRYEEAFSNNPALISFLQTLLSYLPARCTVLDVGCGTGKPVAATLADAGHSVIGIDFSPEMLRLSSKAVPSGRFEHADMRDYQPPAALHFDAILDILSHFVLDREEIENLIRRQASWLKPGGLLCIVSIAVEDVPAEKVEGRFDDDNLCARHVPWRFLGEDAPIPALFTRLGWNKVLADAGLEVVYNKTEVYEAPKEANTDKEPQYFIIAKQKQ